MLKPQVAVRVRASVSPRSPDQRVVEVEDRWIVDGAGQSVAQQMRRGDHPDLARKSRSQMLQSVAAFLRVGKSHLASALGHRACRRSYDVVFTTATHLLAELAGGHADRSFAARVKQLAKPALLIVDDWAMRKFTATQAADAYELLCERVGRPGKALVLTSNRSPADWYPLFPNAVVGQSILDRVLNSSHHLLLEGKSYRPTRRPGTKRS